MRGNPPGGFASRLEGRSIPASAGEPPPLHSLSGWAAVYPRECGGTALAVPGAYAVEGLSPRVRGNRSAAMYQLGIAGSIPASAGEPAGKVVVKKVVRGLSPRVRGEPPCASRSGGPCPVYPRECGGTPDVRVGPAAWPGLSPRVRGNPCIPVASVDSTRSIPASAGEPR